MLSYIVTCVLLMLSAVHAEPLFTRSYDHFQQLMPTYQIYWTVNEAAQEIYLGFKVQTTGWFGFGIAEPESGSMPGADIMVAFVKNGVTNVTDSFSVATAKPPPDTTCQDWVTVYGDESDGVTLVEVTRKLDTGDQVQDRVIPAGAVAVIFSHSPDNNDELKYHKTNRGTGFINFYGIAPQIGQLLQDPTVVVAFPQISSYRIPPQQTTYICQSFELPVDQVRHIIAFQPMIKSTDFAMVHHALIHGCTANAAFFTQYQTPGQCESPVGNTDSGCSDVIFAWARGAQEFFLPSEAGFRVSDGADGGTFRILLQFHYDNPKSIVGAVDQSGFKIFMTNQLRQHDAGVMIMGDPKTSSAPIPAGSPYTEYEYACSPTCTKRFTQPLQVFANAPHMHAYGARLWTTHWRNGVQLPDAIRTEYFSWTFQNNLPVNHQILPGDRLNVHCVYDTTKATADVTFGKNSTQEMCMDFISYWPKQTGFFVCGAVHVPPTNQPLPFSTPTNISVCQSDKVILPTRLPEVGNPAIFGYDPVDQRLRHFGNEIRPSTGLTCPSATTVAPTTPPPTEAPTTPVPTTVAPATEAPATDAPATDAPATEAPATDAPATEAPATDAPATEAPATDAPATQAPATDAPATEAPATDAAATHAPATDAPISARTVDMDSVRMGMYSAASTTSPIIIISFIGLIMVAWY